MLSQDRMHGLKLRLIDLNSVLFDPAMPGVDLLRLLLRDATDLTMPVEEDGSRTRSSLIEGKDVFWLMSRGWSYFNSLNIFSLRQFY